MYGKQAKLEKFTKVAKNFYLQAQRLLRIYDLRLDSCYPSCHDFRKSEVQVVENGVAYKKNV